MTKAEADDLIAKAKMEGLNEEEKTNLLEYINNLVADIKQDVLNLNNN